MSLADLTRQLESLDLDQLRASALADIRSGKKTRRQKGVKLLRAVDGLQRNNVQPKDLLLTRVPVIPAAFRPYTMAGETFIPGDANELYSDLIKAVDVHRESTDLFGADGSPETARYIRNAVKASYGYAESPNPKIKTRKVSGFLDKILGDNPKRSWVQSKLMAKPQDFVGRGVISPNPDFGMDELGVPDDMAWELFDAHVRRSLSSQGIPVSRALQMMKERHPIARQALETEMKEKPVIYSRAPTWHRLGVISGYAKVVDGHNIMISPLTTAGLGADFNGDQQMGKVFVLTDKVENSHILHKALTLPLPRSTIDDMVTKSVIPAFDTAKKSLHIVDLEDFPRAEQLADNPHGKNGHIILHAVPPGLQVLGLDESTNCPVWADVLYYSIHPQRKIEVVNLSNGRQIMTDDDPRAVYGLDPTAGDWSFGRYRPSEALARRVLVPCVKNVAEACRSLGTLSQMEVPGINGAPLQVPLDWEFGYLLGALTGDGWWDKRDYNGRRCLYLADLSQQVAARVYQILLNIFGPGVNVSTRTTHKEEGDDRYGDTARHTFYFNGSRGFTEFLSLWLGGAAGDNHTGSGAKVLPDFFLLAPEEFRKGLLAGYVDTDGTVSRSNAKERPQLMISTTTTSRRLASDVKFLCLTLGIGATLAFSKTTERGNTSWIVSMSTPDAKRTEGIFDRLSCSWKRENFSNTEVSQNNTSLVFDKVPVPEHLYRRVLADIGSPRKAVAGRSFTEEEEKFREDQRHLYSIWHPTGTSRTLSRPSAERVLAGLEQLAAARHSAIALALEDLAKDEPVTPLRVAIWRAGFFAASPIQDDNLERRKQAVGMYARTNGVLRKMRTSDSFLKASIDWLTSVEPYKAAHETECFRTWWGMFVKADQIAWAAVEEVLTPDIKEDGYDLTVPGYETFMSADGVILSNTMSIHAPMLPEAIKDAKEKLLPSRMLFSIRNRDVTVPTPKHEQISGLANSQLNPSEAVHRFNTKEEALAGIKSGAVKLQDQVEIGP